MKFNDTCSVARRLAVACLAVLFVSDRADAEIIMTISDNGTDLTMTATGSYDVSSLEPSIGNTFLGVNAVVVPTKGNFGWDTASEEGSKEYSVEFIGDLTGTGGAAPATSTTGTSPFFFLQTESILSLPGGAPSTGEVNETAVFAGVTLASLGMVAGESMNVVWEGDSAVIQTIPEPASLGLIGLVSGCIYFSRRFFMV
jgi:hypothetical protein